LAGERPHALREPTAIATAVAIGRRRHVSLDTYELVLDRNVDVFEPATDAPCDLRVHEHGGQVDGHVHVAHAVHPGGRAERVPQVTVNGEQGRVERDQRRRVPGHRLARGHPEHGVRAVQVPLDVQQRSVPASGARDRQRAHQTLERHLERGDDGRGRVLYAHRPACRGRPRVLRHGPHAAGQARGQHGQVQCVPPDVERVLRLRLRATADRFPLQCHRCDQQALPHSQQDI